jgi:hypothetical protein
MARKKKTPDQPPRGDKQARLLEEVIERGPRAPKTAHEFVEDEMRKGPPEGPRRIPSGNS